MILLVVLAIGSGFICAINGIMTNYGEGLEDFENHADATERAQPKPDAS